MQYHTEKSPAGIIAALLIYTVFMLTVPQYCDIIVTGTDKYPANNT